jgi:hypothetical protein
VASHSSTANWIRDHAKNWLHNPDSDRVPSILPVDRLDVRVGKMRGEGILLALDEKALVERTL